MKIILKMVGQDGLSTDLQVTRGSCWECLAYRWSQSCPQWIIGAGNLRPGLPNSSADADTDTGAGTS